MRGAHKAGRRQAPRSHPNVLSNLQSVLLHAAPTVPTYAQYSDLDSPSSTGGSYFTLQDLWQSYEAWSAYGCEVPLRINVDGVWQEVIQCYTPHLSGLQLFGADHTRRIPNSSSSAAVSSYCSEDENEGSESVDCVGVDSCSTSSACTSSAASTASTNSDSDSEEACKDSPMAVAARLARRAVRGSVLQKQHNLGEPTQPLFEYMEVERPHLRQPLHDKILELAEQCPELLTLDTRDLHPTSWFAVTWVPIYRVPSVPDPAASRDLQANFLTFHSLAVPQQRLHVTTADLCSIAPLPPLLDPIGAAAVAWRTEVARQALLANTLSALAAAQQEQQRQRQAMAAVAAELNVNSLPASPSSMFSSAASRPHSTSSSVSALVCQLSRASLDAGAPTSHAKLPSPPVSVACLRPFAFMPYKVSGSTWVDDWNLQRQHLPMVAAAGSWIERRKVQLPDFDFMSQMYRPLPTGGFHHHRGGR